MMALIDYGDSKNYEMMAILESEEVHKSHNLAKLSKLSKFSIRVTIVSRFWSGTVR